MPSEQNARPDASVGKPMSSEAGPRGNVDREDDARETATPPPIDRRGTDAGGDAPDRTQRLAKAGRADFDPNEESPA